MLPYGRQTIDEDDIAAVVAVLRSDFLTQGPAVPAFERALADTCGTDHAVAVSSGTAALHLIMAGLGIGPGDAVIVPALTFAATANAVRYQGAVPVFADVDSRTLTLAPASAAMAVDLAISEGLRPKAVVPVHYAGLPADMAGLRAVADSAGAWLIEDACHALGATYRHGTDDPWMPVGGGLADAAAWSFHPVKHVAGGEGGAVTTADPVLAQRVRALRSHGIIREAAAFTAWDAAVQGPPPPWYTEMTALGWNYRLSDIHAALATSQLGKLTASTRRRRQIAAAYRGAWVDLPYLTLPPEDHPTGRHSYHLFAIQIDWQALGSSRMAVMAELAGAGIGTQVHYLPVYRHLDYQRQPQAWRAVPCPVSEAFYDGALSVPMYPALTDGDVGVVAAGVRRLLTHRAP